MAGGKAIAHEGEEVAEGIIAKAAKDSLRDAVGPGMATKDAAKATEEALGRDSAKVAAEIAERDKVLKDAVTKASQDLRNDPTLLEQHLSDAELAVLEEKPYLIKAQFGKAVERRAAEDPAVATAGLRHVGGASKPDFVDDLGLGYEVTTSNETTVATHLLRDYVSADRMATYDPIPFNFVDLL